MNKFLGILELGSSSIKLTYPSKDFKEAAPLEKLEVEVRRIELDQSMKSLDLNYFKTTLLPEIIAGISKLLQRVHRVSIIATGYWRELDNKDDIVLYIKQETNQDVHFLSQEDEGELSCISFLRTISKKIEVGDQNINIDLGGNSTEVSFYDKIGKSIQTISLPIGTNLALELMRENKELDFIQKMEMVSNEHDAILSELFMLQLNPLSLKSVCSCTGGVIKKAAHMHVNPNSKGRGSRMRIHNIQIETERLEKMSSMYWKAAQLPHNKEAFKANELKDEPRDILLGALCLPIYVNIAKKLKLEFITINTTGISYGFFFKHLSEN